ncbi:MAG: hypothetical protein ACPIBN_05860 [Candidatus Poseidoniaceae archaeon]
MSEKIVHIMFPSFEKMDHAIPSVRYIAKKAREIRATQIQIQFVPLHATTLANLPLFLKVFGSQMDSEIGANQELYEELSVIIADAPRPLAKASDWEAVLDEYIVESRDIGLNYGMWIALGNDPLPEIILQTSIASLSHSNLRLIRVPVGYNLQTPQEFFLPGLPLSDQVQELRLLGGHQIREPLLEVLKAPAVCEALLAIRELHDMHSNQEREIGFTPNQIIQFINSNRKRQGTKQELSSSALTNNKGPLIEYKLVRTEKRRHILLPLGIYISGLLRKNEYQGE